MEEYFRANLEVHKEYEQHYGSKFEEIICRRLAVEIVEKIPLNHLKDIFNFSSPVKSSPFTKVYDCRIPVHPVGMISVKKELPLLNKKVIIWYGGEPQIAQLLLLKNGELTWILEKEATFYDEIEFWKHI